MSQFCGPQADRTGGPLLAPLLAYPYSVPQLGFSLSSDQPGKGAAEVKNVQPPALCRSCARQRR